MSSPATTQIACASPQFVEQADSTELDDWLSYFDPAIVLLTGEAPAPRAASFLRRRISIDTLLFHPAGNAPASGSRRVDDVQFVFAPTVQTLREIHKYEQHDLNTSTPTFVLSGLLNLNVDTTTLSTSLVGREQYMSALDMDHLDGEYVHISTKLQAEYRREWDGLTVIGGDAEAGYADTPLVALDCRDDGRVLTRSLKALVSVACHWFISSIVGVTTSMLTPASAMACSPRNVFPLRGGRRFLVGRGRSRRRGQPAGSHAVQCGAPA